MGSLVESLRVFTLQLGVPGIVNRIELVAMANDPFGLDSINYKWYNKLFPARENPTLSKLTRFSGSVISFNSNYPLFIKYPFLKLFKIAIVL
jgi:hypothetical protein